MEYEVTVVTLDNGQDYMIVKDSVIDGKRYCYFVNENDETDICVRRIDKIENEDHFVYLDNDQEFNQVMEHFIKEIKEA